ncbi:MAG: SDR family NAD(P)-dependent oxidoreductase [Immundisolibacter sp.]|uniref:SDR family NAD(P)-dependent oxidoreductase n=1 Tax=Immundisolibacter sp. TaxID=1934948 RepID=UPI003D12625A
MLQDKTAIVTGAGTGIGRAIARTLHAHGARVVLAGRRRDRLDATAALLGDRTRVVPTDVTVPDQVQALAAAAAEFGQGRIDILVNNAGVMRFAPFQQADEAHWQTLMDVNCWGPRRLMTAVLPAMRGGGGSIVNIASIAGEHAFPGAAAYGAAKRALRHVSQVLAMEEAAHGIRVNVICPGVVEDTDLLDGAVPAEKQAGFLTTFAGLHPLGRNGKPDDVADAVLFFASPLSRWITGAVLPLDGGRHLATNRPKLD